MLCFVKNNKHNVNSLFDLHFRARKGRKSNIERWDLNRWQTGREAFPMKGSLTYSTSAWKSGKSRGKWLKSVDVFALSVESKPESNGIKRGARKQRSTVDKY